MMPNGGLRFSFEFQSFLALFYIVVVLIWLEIAHQVWLVLTEAATLFTSALAISTCRWAMARLCQPLPAWLGHGNQGGTMMSSSIIRIDNHEQLVYPEIRGPVKGPRRHDCTPQTLQQKDPKHILSFQNNWLLVLWMYVSCAALITLDGMLSLFHRAHERHSGSPSSWCKAT